MNWLVDLIGTMGDREALVDSSGEYSYADLSEQCSKYRAEFESQIKQGDVVAILSDYNFYSISLFLALLDINAIIVPIVSEINEEIKDRIDISKCDFVTKLDKNGKLDLTKMKCEEKHELVNELKANEDSGLILFSSGSTGKPKAMIHNLNKLVESYKGKKNKKLKMLVFLMFDHIGGLNTLLNSLAMGARIILPMKRDAEEVAKLIQKYKVKILPASPTFLNLMLIGNVAGKYDLSSLKMITYGTEPMTDGLLVRLRKVFGKVRFLQTFGTSETGIAQTVSRSSDSLEMKIDDPNLEYKIVNDELWLKSKTQVLGYLNAENESFTDDGWFKTGDLVEDVGEGYLRIIGRNKEVINVGGEKVLPSEIESVLFELQEIDDVLVKGVPNAITGQSVVADVVWNADDDKKEVRKRIRAHCKALLSSYKVPTKINIVDSVSFSNRFKKKRIL